jgi:hypothetical protein
MQVTLYYLYQHLLRETDKTTDILINILAGIKTRKFSAVVQEI